MNAVLRRKSVNKPKQKEPESRIAVDKDDEFAFRIDCELAHPVYSIPAGAKELGVTQDKLRDAVAAFGIKARKRLVYRSGKKMLAYYIKDFYDALRQRIEQSYENPSQPMKNMHPEKYGKDRPGKLSEELRLTKARADKAELELREAAGDLIELQTVVQDVGDMHASFKARLLGTPPKLAASLPVDMRSEAEAHARKLINEALEELAQYRPKVSRRAGSNAEAATDTESE